MKRLSEAKHRLAKRFGDVNRRAIAEALLEDALELCHESDFLQWWVVSDDDVVLERADRDGLRTIRDPGTGLNSAVATAAEVVLAAGADSVTVVPVDVPLAWRGDIQDLLDTGATSDVVVVPSERDGGTNGLYLSPPDAMTPRFGSGSLRAHVAQAERLGYRCSILSLPRLGLDLDTERDIEMFLSRAHGQAGASRTHAVLSSLL